MTPITPDDQTLREQALALLRGGHAHMTLAQAVDNFPLEHINTRAPNVSYTFWHLLEHIRIAQWDILEFVRRPDYTSPPWPEGYWPDPAADATLDRWQETLNAIQADRDALLAMVQDPSVDLTAPLPHAPDYTLLREVLLVADHTAYHVGEFAILRQVAGLWPEKRPRTP